MDGIFPLTVDAHESMFYLYFLPGFNKPYNPALDLLECSMKWSFQKMPMREAPGDVSILLGPF